MAAIRRAEATWSGPLTTGSGEVSGISSGTFSGLPVSWGSRTENADGRTSPEELLAAAHASCFSMAFATRLAKAGVADPNITVTAKVTFGPKPEGGNAVLSSALNVRAQAPDGDAAKLKAVAEDAKENCPISKALKGNVALSVEATPS